MLLVDYLFVQQSSIKGVQIAHQGYVDHICELVTNKSFSDTTNSEEAMIAARKLVSSFSDSSQMEAILHAKQSGNSGPPLGVVQDVATRW